MRWGNNSPLAGELKTVLKFSVLPRKTYNRIEPSYGFNENYVDPNYGFTVWMEKIIVIKRCVRHKAKYEWINVAIMPYADYIVAELRGDYDTNGEDCKTPF